MMAGGLLGILFVLVAVYTANASECTVTTYDIRTRVVYMQSPAIQTYECGLFNWARCTRLVLNTVSVEGFEFFEVVNTVCCAGYTRSHEGSCVPVCDGNCQNRGSCVAPNQCNCNSGWTGTGCTDNVNECARPETNNCQFHDQCMDNSGSYTCGCPTGYTLNTDGLTCSPVCTGNCAGRGTCTSPNLCACTSAGWTGNDCTTDINECANTNTNNCDQVCNNNVGTYTCGCRSGYRLDTNGFTCSDINECVEGTHQCSQICMNTGGTYSCSCRGGFILRNDGRGCMNEDECALGTARCAQNCRDTPGSYTCGCNSGYNLDANGFSCNDIDECTLETDQCSHICTNTPGSYRCSCHPGYLLLSDGRSCTNIDECLLGSAACAQLCEDTTGSYTCRCRAGYNLAPNGFLCNDINECAGGTDSCDHVCRNTIGSYTCSCNTGYTLGNDGFSCTNDNECTLGTALCAHNCEDTPGSYDCSCNLGYSLDIDGFSCSDIDECDMETDQCDHNCTNTVGSYSCSCAAGFNLSPNGHSCSLDTDCVSGTDSCAQNCIDEPGVNNYRCSCRVGYDLDTDGFACNDINECALETDQCAHSCTNTIGSYTCSCNAGYILSSNGFNCINIDECALNTDQCDQHCHDNVGSYTCSCSTAYTLDANGFTCNDNNECVLGTDECGQLCTNTVGSYTCSCNTGYTLSSNGFNCTNDDECILGTHNCSHHCHDTPGSYTCSCRPGYSLDTDGLSCNDVDECTLGTDQCVQNCMNTVGSYICSCDTGYALSSNGFNCTNEDECLLGINNCAQNCHDTIGSFTCSCRTGFQGDGITCNDIDECAIGTHICAQNCMNTVGSYTCSCDSGYTYYNESTCLNNDECVLGTDDCVHNCHDTPGSYNCSCNPGYTLNADGFSCSDANECILDTDNCEHICHNSIGTYVCSCESGFTLNRNNFSCDDINECESPTTNDCQQICTNIPGFYTCACESGYRLDINGRGCSDVDECFEDVDNCEDNCHNSVGAFTCTCNAPKTLASNGQSCLDPVYCEAEVYEEYSWHRTLMGEAATNPCSMEGINGEVSRHCMTNGTWSAVVNVTGCSRDIFEKIAGMSNIIFSNSSNSTSYIDVARIISDVSNATSVNSTGDLGLYPSDINTTNHVVADSIEFLMAAAESGELQPFNEELIDVFDNLLNENNDEGWEQIQMTTDVAGSPALLRNVENYAAYVGNAIVNDNIETGNATTILLLRTNIELDAVAIPTDERDIDNIYFPDLEGDKERTFGNAPVQAKLPRDLLIERGALDTNITAVNVVFDNLETILPSLGNETRAGSPIISSQILSDLATSEFDNKAEFYLKTARYNKKSFNAEDPRCAFIQVVDSENIDWSVDGVKTLSVERVEEGDFVHFEVICQSSHLTSFAILVDVHGVTSTISEEEGFALTIVTYIGCGISILFLAISIILVLSMGKQLFTSVHYFVHLNLFIALMLAYILFVAGLENATRIRAACVVVAALLHYLYTAVFCWMLCEGIMLYLMLVVVFSKMAKKWWLFLLLGWGVPVIPVVVSVGVLHEDYGTENYCWLRVDNSSSGIIWAFVAPMLLAIVLNIFFLVAALRSVYKVRKEKSKNPGKKEEVKLFWKIFLASLVLLPLLGVTWVFGLFAVNTSLTVFIWIFTILNSFQGFFIFIFHVIRNDKLTKKIRTVLCGKPKDKNTSYTSVSGQHSIRKHPSVLGKPKGSVMIPDSALLTLNRSGYNFTTFKNDNIDDEDDIVLDPQMFCTTDADDLELVN